MRQKWFCRLIVTLLCLASLPAHAHVGNKDVFEELMVGPYKLFVTVRMPLVIPGVAQIEVRESGAPVDEISITPVPMVGEASKHPPTADAMKRSKDDPNFYTGSLWIMASGSWKVQFQVKGAQGSATGAVPIPAAPLQMLPMEKSLGVILALLGVVLAVGIAGIVAAAVRESRVTPGAAPGPDRKRRALVAGVATFALVIVAILLGDKWWNVEAAGYAGDLFRPLQMTPTLNGDTLLLHVDPQHVEQTKYRRSRSNKDFVLDHGQIMHLYAIREPQMDAAFHLHPTQVGPGELKLQLPAMPPGQYRLYGDVVHANGFSETLLANLTVPAGLQAAPLAADDAQAAPGPLSQGELGPSYKLPDGYTMVWDRPAELKANQAYSFQFRLLGPDGKPAVGMQPYLGMAGHAAFVKTDGSVFAHTHPDGSAAMPAMAIANGDANSDMTMGGMAGMNGMDGGSAMQAAVVSPEVEFPYGFPSPGRYRIFIQMKHRGVVETGVFDADVQ